jgi:hypothetical protein
MGESLSRLKRNNFLLVIEDLFFSLDDFLFDFLFSICVQVLIKEIFGEKGVIKKQFNGGNPPASPS